MVQEYDKAGFDASLARMGQMTADGQFAQALQLADELLRAPAGMPHPMGPDSVAGIPRRLHAARLRLAGAQGDQIAKLGWQAMQGPALDCLLPLAQFSPEERRLAAQMAQTPVPRLLHQIWIGPRARPVTLNAWQAWCAMNGREYRLWDEAALATLGVAQDPTYRQMLAQGDYPGAVDVARYLVLQAQGGIYLDADFHPARDDTDFDDYLPPTGLSALTEDTPRITGRGSLLLTNALIAAPAAHPAIAALIRTLPAAMAAIPNAPAWWVTGPLIFTLFARLCPLGIAAHDIVAGRLPRGAPAAELQRFRNAQGLLIDWKCW